MYGEMYIVRKADKHKYVCGCVMHLCNYESSLYIAMYGERENRENEREKERERDGGRESERDIIWLL